MEKGDGEEGGGGEENGIRKVTHYIHGVSSHSHSRTFKVE